METRPDDPLNIEVAYANQTSQTIICLKVDSNASVVEAIQLSGLLSQYPEIIITETIPIGIFGKRINPINYKLKPHDRIEIYRPLAKTPNQRRLERSSHK